MTTFANIIDALLAFLLSIKDVTLSVHLFIQENALLALFHDLGQVVALLALGFSILFFVRHCYATAYLDNNFNFSQSSLNYYIPNKVLDFIDFINKYNLSSSTTSAGKRYLKFSLFSLFVFMALNFYPVVLFAYQQISLFLVWLYYAIAEFIGVVLLYLSLYEDGGRFSLTLFSSNKYSQLAFILFNVALVFLMILKVRIVSQNNPYFYGLGYYKHHINQDVYEALSSVKTFIISMFFAYLLFSSTILTGYNDAYLLVSITLLFLTIQPFVARNFYAIYPSVTFIVSGFIPKTTDKVFDNLTIPENKTLFNIRGKTSLHIQFPFGIFATTNIVARVLCIIMIVFIGKIIVHYLAVLSGNIYDAMPLHKSNFSFLVLNLFEPIVEVDSFWKFPLMIIMSPLYILASVAGGKLLRKAFFFKPLY